MTYRHETTVEEFADRSAWHEQHGEFGKAASQRHALGLKIRLAYHLTDDQTVERKAMDMVLSALMVKQPDSVMIPFEELRRQALADRAA